MEWTPAHVSRFKQFISPTLGLIQGVRRAAPLAGGHRRRLRQVLLLRSARGFGARPGALRQSPAVQPSSRSIESST